MSEQKSIVFLYSELAGYVLACLKTLASEPNVRLTVLHWSVKPEAPFQLPENPGFELINRSDLSQSEIISIVNDRQPDTIVLSGWMDKDYLAVAKQWKPIIPVVLTMDNHWTGSIKQWLSIITAPFFIHKHYNRAWVPGNPQIKFADKLGFKGENLKTGFYCADVEAFRGVYERRKAKGFSSKKLLYLGRYVASKGLEELWTVFTELSSEFPDWELHCVGTGEGWDSRVLHPKIKHHGFLQPSEILPLIEDASAFVMPSRFEPWGVALHEMAAAGIPLLVSEAVGAASAFLVDQENGFLFKPNDKVSLKKALLHYMTNCDTLSSSMSEKSNLLSLKITPSIWAETALSWDQ